MVTKDRAGASWKVSWPLVLKHSVVQDGSYDWLKDQVRHPRVQNLNMKMSINGHFWFGGGSEDSFASLYYISSKSLPNQIPYHFLRG